MRRLFAISILTSVVLALGVFAPAASATVWYRDNCYVVIGVCGSGPAHHLVDSSGSSTYWTFGHQADPAGYCVHYESGRVPAMNVPDDRRFRTGYLPPTPLASYQMGDLARDRVCGTGGVSWEHYIAASACMRVGYWCGSVHWTFLPGGNYPWARSQPHGLTIGETIGPDNVGSLEPVATVLPGGAVGNLFCALLTDPGSGLGAQNLELCYVPWQSSSYYNASFNVEAPGSTPEQAGPGSSMDTPAVRLVVVSDRQRYGDWLSGSTVTGGAPPVQARYAIRITSTKLSNVVRDANAYIQQNSIGRCGPLNLNYLLDRYQCIRLFDQAVDSYRLTALEQDGEGYGFSRWGWSESDLEAKG